MSWKAQEEEAEGGTEFLKGMVGATGSSSWCQHDISKTRHILGNFSQRKPVTWGTRETFVTRSSMKGRIFSFALRGCVKGKSREEPHWGRIISKRESELWIDQSLEKDRLKAKGMNTAQRTDKTSWLCVKCWGQMIIYERGGTVNAWVLHGTWDIIVSWVSQPGWKPHWKWAAHFLSSQGIFSTNPSNLLLYVYI